MKRILFFTGTRADYGLLSSLIRLFYIDKKYHVEILASGSHLEKKFGNTVKEIESDGFNVKYRIKIQLTKDTALSVSHSAGIGLSSYAQVLNEFKPDLCFVLGDRFEALSFAFACHIFNIKLAHLYGGEVTLGAIDNSFRHCITMLSQYHFTSAKVNSMRVIQMREDRSNVFTVGALGVDNAIKIVKNSKSHLARKNKIDFKKVNFLVTFHPETVSKYTPLQQINEVLKAIQLFINSNSESYFIFTLPNSDPGNQLIYDSILRFTEENINNTIAFAHLGIVNYLSTMVYCHAVVGNSSSGLVEAPALGVPTLNIGDRQKGRLMSKSIMNCKIDALTIFNKLNTIKMFDKSKIKKQSLYGSGKSAIKIKHITDKILEGKERKRLHGSN